MSGTTTLLCWVIDTPVDEIFPVKIGYDEMWGAVKDAIKVQQKPEFDDIAAKTLRLWQVRYCAISHVVAQLTLRLHKAIPPHMVQAIY